MKIRAQKAHTQRNTHTQVQSLWGLEEKEGGREKGGFDFIWLRLHLSPSIKQAEKHGACTAAKSIQTQRARRQIKRGIDGGERERGGAQKLKKQRKTLAG